MEVMQDASNKNEPFSLQGLVSPIRESLVRKDHVHHEKQTQ